MPEPRPRALFLGYMDEIAAAIAAHDSIDLAGVFLEKQRTRSGAARNRLQGRGVAVTLIDRLSTDEAFRRVLEAGVDLIFVGGFGQILRDDILGAPALGVVNFHPSYLPEYRGGWPIEWHILNGETEGGITLHWVDAGVDTGPIVAQARIPLHARDDYDDVYRRAETTGAQLVTDLLDRPPAEWPRQPQGEGTRKASPRKPEMGRIDWRRSAVDIDRLVRADGWKGWVRSELPSGPLVLLKTEPEPAAGREGASGRHGAAGRATPGQVLAAGDVLRVVTGDGVLRIDTYESPQPLAAGDVLPSGVASTA